MGNIRYYFPSLSRLWSSFRIRNRELLRENTLHGFPYFVNPRRPLWERIVWFLATVASIASAIGIIITIYQTFQAEPTLTGLDTDTEELHTYFPSVTLCSYNPNFNYGRYAADSAYYDMMYRWAFDSTEGIEPSMNLEDETFSQFYYQISPGCGDLLQNCTFGSRDGPCEEFFKKRILNRGVCCFFDASLMTKESGYQELTFDTTFFPMGLDLLAKDEKPPSRTSPFTYLLLTGTTFMVTIQLTFSTPNVASLGQSQRKCHYPDEDESYSMCIHKCLKKDLIKRCGCVPWFMALADEIMECPRAQYNCMGGNGTDFKLPVCKCYLPCNHTTYKLDSIEVMGDNHVEIAVPNWPTVTYKRELRFGWLDLLVSFGGIAGLFVGYSLLTTVELTYYLSLRTYCGAVLAGSEKTIKIKVKKAKKDQQTRVISVVDVKKDYYSYVE